MAQQSLYRRYRPRRFAELRGQDHVSKALRHAVASNSEGHAYLFSGPRGTGKTSTARILAKALNCTDLTDGEPCDVCDSCVSMNAGTSYDLFELDAASNNGVDAVRDLISRTAVGSPGRTKVYILDEVHMLSTPASNALLKTLEEPPEHVVFVLATTDPHKVLPTIRSRTQHFEFSLLSADELTDYVGWVIKDAGLDVDPESVPYVVRQGRGSARDTLSALDRVVAAGGIAESATPVDDLLAAIGDRTAGRALAAVAAAITTGSEPRTIGEALLVSLRDAFLVAVSTETPHLTVDDRERASALAARLGTAGVTRSLEMIGAALVEMRQATDPRIPLEVAVVRLASPELDSSPSALVERIDALERALSDGGVRPSSTTAAIAPARSEQPAPPTPDSAPSPVAAATPVADATPDAPTAAGSGPAAARERLASIRQPSAATRPAATPRADSPTRAGPPPRPSGAAPPNPRSNLASGAAPTNPSAEAVADPAASESLSVHDPAPEIANSPAAAPPPPSNPSGTGIDLEQARTAIGNVVASHLKGAVRAIFAGGEVVDASDSQIVMSFGNGPTLQRAEKGRAEVEAALLQSVGAVKLKLIEAAKGAPYRSGSTATGAHSTVGHSTSDPAVNVEAQLHDAGGSGATDDDAAQRDAGHDGEPIDVTDLVDAPNVATSGVDRLVQAFPGAVVLDPEQSIP